MQDSDKDLIKLLEDLLANKGTKVPVTSRIDTSLNAELLKIKARTGRSKQVLLDIAIRLLVKVYGDKAIQDSDDPKQGRSA